MRIKTAAKVSVWCAVAIGVAVAPTLARPEKAQPADTRFIVGSTSGYFLGAVKDGRWIKDKPASRLMQGGEKYALYTGTRVTGNATGAKAKTEGAPCEDTYYVKFKGVDVQGIAVSGPPLKAPRPVVELDRSSVVYRAEVAKWLKARGIKKPQVNIAKIWRADLDGDGTDEVLISAIRHQGKSWPFEALSPDAAAGDYSLLLLRRTGKGGVQTVPIANEIYPQAKKFNAPSINELVSLLDFNGDGRLEIVLRGRYYEGDSIGVYEYRNGAVHDVLESGCGV